MRRLIRFSHLSVKHEAITSGCLAWLSAKTGNRGAHRAWLNIMLMHCHSVAVMFHFNTCSRHTPRSANGQPWPICFTCRITCFPAASTARHVRLLRPWQTFPLNAGRGSLLFAVSCCPPLLRLSLIAAATSQKSLHLLWVAGEGMTEEDKSMRAFGSHSFPSNLSSSPPRGQIKAPSSAIPTMCNELLHVFFFFFKFHSIVWNVSRQ